MKTCDFFLLFINIFSTCSALLINLGNVTIQHVCENQHLNLKCSNENETLQIIRSMYGRTSQRICNDDHLTSRIFHKTCANIEQSKAQSKLYCHGKSSCQIFIDNQIFTDPCGTTISKHFEIHYRCIDRGRICPDLIANCSKFNDLKCLEKIHQDFSCSCPSTICRYKNHRLIGFVEPMCPEENLDGIQWKETLINRTEFVRCPKPCQGRISRHCSVDRRWLSANFTDCECPINQSDQLSRHRLAHGYVFECNFWLIKRLWPLDNSCINSFTNWNRTSSNCLWSAFQQISRESCDQSISFGIDFDNLQLQILVANQLEEQIHFPSSQKNTRQTNSLIIDRLKSTSNELSTHQPNRWMMIDQKNQSIILIEEQIEKFQSIQTANVTVVFELFKQTNKVHYQCRAYRPLDFSLNIDSSDMFFACQTLCSNGSQVICQCPFFNPFMHYTLHVDTTVSEFDWKFSIFENSLHGKCDQLSTNSLDELINDLSNGHEQQSRTKKLLDLFDSMIEIKSSHLHWTEMIERIDRIGLKLMPLVEDFSSLHSHFQFFIRSDQFEFENDDRSVMITINIDPSKQTMNFDFHTIFFTLSSSNVDSSINSDVARLTVVPNYNEFLSLIKNVEIRFKHKRFFNRSRDKPICVDLKFIENEAQWINDACRWMSSNETHTVCSCVRLTTFALMIEPIVVEPKLFLVHRFLILPKISSIFVLLCLALTLIVISISRRRQPMSDDLLVVRNIFHGNGFLCLFIVELLFLFGIDQTKSQFFCRVMAILLDYFLLATFSWFFVDGIELLLAMKHPFKIDRIRLIAYSLYSYGFPLLVVFLSLIISAQSSISTDYCWSSYSSGHLWAFAIPFLLLILVNGVFLIISTCPTLTTQSQLKFSLRIVSIQSILFGFTWLFGLIYLFDSSKIFAYLFSISNCLHGLFICFSEKSIRRWPCEKNYLHTKYQSFLSRSSKTISNVTQLNEKSAEHFSTHDNASTSGYSSAHSSEICQKQILSVGSTLDPSYLPSVPIHQMMNARLTAYRYPLPSTDQLILVREQQEQLLEKSNRHDDDHQYYEIG